MSSVRRRFETMNAQIAQLRKTAVARAEELIHLRGELEKRRLVEWQLKSTQGELDNERARHLRTKNILLGLTELHVAVYKPPTHNGTDMMPQEPRRNL